MDTRAYVRSSVRVAMALTIALLTIISPLCAPWCAATACATGNSTAVRGADGCHRTFASTVDGSSAIGAPQLCNLKGLPAAALRDAKSSTERHAKRTHSLYANTTAANESMTGQLSPSLLPPGSATLKNKPPATTILRI